MNLIGQPTFLPILTLSLIVAVVSASDLQITCDFDLENIEAILPHLPEKCSTLYQQRVANKALYQVYAEEAKQFGIFAAKLDRYERRNIIEPAKKPLEAYPFDALVRKQIYTQADLGMCVTTAKDTAEHYLQCVLERRLQLIDLVPSA